MSRGAAGPTGPVWHTSRRMARARWSERGRTSGPAASTAEAGAGTARPGPLRRAPSAAHLAPGLLAASWLVPAVCSVVALALADSYHPYADIALIELHVRDVGSEEVLLGPYSRFGWSHPGPMLYYLLAVPYRLLGSASGGIAVGALAINTAALMGITAIAWRRGGPMVGALAFLLMGMTVRALGPQFLRDPWNPHLPVLPFALLLLTAWSLAVGKRWALPAAALLGSFVVQSHIGFAPVTAVVLGVALVGFVRSRPVRPLPAAVLAAVVLALVWLPPLIEEVVRQPGNLRALIDFYGQEHETSGLGNGWRAVALQLGPVPEWLVGRRSVSPFNGAVELPSVSVPVALVPLALVTVLALRRRWRDVTWLCALVIALTVAAVLSTSRIIGALYPYLTVWTAVVGVMAWLAIGAGAARWVREVRPEVGRPVTAVLLLAGAGLLVGTSVSAARAGVPVAVDSRIVGVLGQQMSGNLPEDVEVVHLRPVGSFNALLYLPGVANELERDGRRVEVSPTEEAAFGRNRVACTEGSATLLVMADAEAKAAAQDGSLELVARARTTPEEERSSRGRVRDRIRAEGRAASLSDEEIERILESVPTAALDVAVYRDGDRRCDGT